jgi:ADP-ribosyl-[dinitrogen reductase] hydrolase
MLHAIDRSRGCLLGLAIGDAVGTTVEFKTRGSFAPLTDMQGGGPFALNAGEWTDDTSMALCLAHSLIFKRGFDAIDQMNRYCNWYQHGYMSSNGRCFDIGITVRGALERYLKTQEPFAGSTAADTAGNGSLMRLAPIAIFYRNQPNDMGHWAAESSRTTHATQACLEACRLFATVLACAISGADKHTVLLAAAKLESIESDALRSIAQAAYLDKPVEAIRGSGYVVASLEAALWCFAKTNHFSDAILQAANLGEDADTTAAICGQIAGAYYGVQGIPDAWLEKLVMRAEITTLADQLHEFGEQAAG